MDVVLATGNQGKVAEMQATLASFGMQVLPQSQFNISPAIENGLSFVENAIIKARHACQHTKLGAIADDSGLEVDALDGAPGIYSARYASSEKPASDAANIDKLLAQLEGVEQRTARFQCVLVYLRHAHDPTPIICQGTWQGNIAEYAMGENGFGYDPIFYLPELNCTAAQLTSVDKKQISHRAQALNQLRSQLLNTP